MTKGRSFKSLHCGCLGGKVRGVACLGWVSFLSALMIQNLSPTTLFPWWSWRAGELGDYGGGWRGFSVHLLHKLFVVIRGSSPGSCER